MTKKVDLPTATKSFLQKEIELNGITISYKDNEVKGDPIIFLHGDSLSSDTFKNQFTSKEFQNNRILAPDMPGHGDSQKAKDAEIFYTLEAFTQIMVNWLESLNISNAIMVGHSMGGHMLMGAWPQIHKRAKGLVIFGAPPFSKDTNLEDSHYGHPAFSLTQQSKLNNEELIQLARLYIKKGATADKVILDSIKKADPIMRQIFGESISEPSNLSDEAENLMHITQPIAILQGRYDKILKRTYYDRFKISMLWRKSVQLIDNAGHCPQIENPEQFNQMLQQFLIDQLI